MLDMAAVRFVRSEDGMSLSALAGTGELIALIDVAPGTADREAALAAFDAALDLARVPRPSLTDPSRIVRTRVALYNPYTCEVAVGALPSTVAFGDMAPLQLPPSGVLASRSADEPDVLVVGARRLPRRVPTPASVSRAYVAHHDR